MQKISLYLLLILITNIIVFAQEEQKIPTQTIRGTVLNVQSKLPVIGATVRVIDTKHGAYTGKDGTFRISKVPTGRYIIQFSAVGFETFQQNIVTNTGKESILNIELFEKAVKYRKSLSVAHPWNR